RRRLHGRQDPKREEEIARTIQQEALAPGSPVDVQSYTLVLKVNPATQRIDGTVRMQALSLVQGLSHLDANLYDVMAISAITTGSRSLAYTRASNVVSITLNRPYNVGQTVDLTIAYGGTPPAVGYGAFTFQTHNNGTQPIASSLSEPTYARAWWPCIDR